MTIPMFDILRVEASGSVLWLESVTTVEDAQQRVQELVRGAPSDYIILDQRTGNKLVVTR